MMKILVHMVKGKVPDHELDVEGDTSVDRLKAILQDRVGTPAKDLIVLYKGKSLQGAKSIESYGVEDGAKLYLAVKVPPPTPEAVTATHQTHNSRFNSLLTQFLLKHFSAKDAEKVTRKVHEAMARHVESPNLDMIERLAKENLEMQKTHKP